MSTIEHTSEIDDICRRFAVVRLDVFGSVAQGTADEDSDIDLLYTLAPGARLGWEIEDLTAELEAVLGRRVDLVSANALNAHLRDSVLTEARSFYAAT